jgi:hypothetical protein
MLDSIVLSDLRFFMLIFVLSTIADQVEVENIAILESYFKISIGYIRGILALIRCGIAHRAGA